MARLVLLALAAVFAGSPTFGQAQQAPSTPPAQPGVPSREPGAPGLPGAGAPMLPAGVGARRAPVVNAGPVKLDCGPEVQPLTINWVEGQWQALPDLLRRGGDKKRRIVITRAETGEYVGGYEPAVPGEENRFVVFKADCYRIAQVESVSPQGKGPVMYAVLSGHSERMSLEFLPAMFPQVWQDKQLIQAVGAGDAPEVPVEKRLAALAILAASIDDKGTFMRQDLTLVRPIPDEPEPVRMPQMPQMPQMPEPGRMPGGPGAGVPGAGAPGAGAPGVPGAPGRLPEPGRLPPPAPGQMPPVPTPTPAPTPPGPGPGR